MYINKEKGNHWSQLDVDKILLIPPSSSAFTYKNTEKIMCTTVTFY